MTKRKCRIILKDSIIWGSIHFVGIPILKFYITPDRISYYNKLDRTFYEGNFNILKRQLGIEIGFEHLQNLLLGDLIKTVDPQLYQLEQFKKYYLFKSSGKDILNQITIAPFYKIIKEKIQTRNNLNMTIQYEDYQKINDQHIPGEIKIFTSGHKHIHLAYKNHLYVYTQRAAQDQMLFYSTVVFFLCLDCLVKNCKQNISLLYSITELHYQGL